MKNLRLITLLFGLTLALPARQVKAAGPAENNNFGWIMAGAALASVIWWNVWGKAWAKGYKAPEKKRLKCSGCLEEFKTKDMITLHPNTKEYLRNNVPSIRMNHRAQYQHENNELSQALIDELPKCPTHKLCAGCTIDHFYNFTTSCAFHYNEGNGHGHCLRCDAKGKCLSCPEIFTEVTVYDNPRDGRAGTPRSYIRFCNVRLDAGWVNRNNPHMRIELEKQYAHNGAEVDRLWKLWEDMCRDYHGNRKK